MELTSDKWGTKKAKNKIAKIQFKISTEIKQEGAIGFHIVVR